MVNFRKPQGDNEMDICIRWCRQALGYNKLILSAFCMCDIWAYDRNTSVNDMKAKSNVESVCPWAELERRTHRIHFAPRNAQKVKGTKNTVSIHDSVWHPSPTSTLSNLEPEYNRSSICKVYTIFQSSNKKKHGPRDDWQAGSSERWINIVSYMFQQPFSKRIQ